MGEGRGDEGSGNAAALPLGMRQQVAHQMHPAALPGRTQHSGDGALQSFMGVGDHQLHTAQTAASELAQKRDPERLRFGSADVQAEHFTPAILVDADGDDRCHRDDAPGLADLYVGGIEPEVGPIPLEGPAQESLYLVIDLATEAADLALRDPTHPHGLHQSIDRARRNALHIRLLDHAGEGLLGHSTRFQEARKIAALAQLRDAQLDRARTGLPVTLTVAVALRQTVRTAGTMRRSRSAPNVQLHPSLPGKT